MVHATGVARSRRLKEIAIQGGLAAAHPRETTVVHLELPKNSIYEEGLCPLTARSETPI